MVISTCYWLIRLIRIWNHMMTYDKSYDDISRTQPVSLLASWSGESAHSVRIRMSEFALKAGIIFGRSCLTFGYMAQPLIGILGRFCQNLCCLQHSKSWSETGRIRILHWSNLEVAEKNEQHMFGLCQHLTILYSNSIYFKAWVVFASGCFFPLGSVQKGLPEVVLMWLCSVVWVGRKT